MDSKLEVNSLRSSVKKLESRFGRLADALAEASNRLKVQQELPSEELEESIRETREDFDKLRREVESVFSTLRIKSSAFNANSPSLQSLSEQVKLIADSQQEQFVARFRDRALGVLHEALQLQHSLQGDSSPLSELRDSAEDFLKRLDNAQAEEIIRDEEALNKELRPFEALLILVEKQAQLEEKECEKFFAQVSQFPGFGMSLALAAVRGRIMKRPEEMDGGAAEMIGVEVQERSLAQSGPEGQPCQEPRTEKLPSTAPEVRVAETEDDELEQSGAVDFIEIQKKTPTLHDEETKEDLFSSDLSASLLASRLLDAQDDPDPAHLQELIWQLLFEGHPDFGYQIGHYLEDNHQDYRLRTPVWLLRAAILGKAVRFHSGNIAAQLKKDFEQYDPEACFSEDTNWNHAIRLLMVAAATQPALLTPASGATAILHDLRLKDGLGELYTLITNILNYADRGIPLDPATLRIVRKESDWQKKMDALREEAGAWLAQAKQAKLLYQGATAVWRAWTNDGAIIDRVINFVQSEGDSSSQDAEGLLHELDNSDVQETWREKRTKSVTKKIEGKALEQIDSKMSEARDFLCRWIQLSSLQPKNKDFKVKQTEKVQKVIKNCKEPVLSELREFLERFQSTSRSISGAGRMCLSSLQDLFLAFEPSSPDVDREEKVRNLLNLPLIALPGQLSDESWERYDKYDIQFLRRLLLLIKNKKYSAEESFKELCEARDHAATARVIAYLQESGRGPDPTPMLEKRLEMLDQCRNALARDIEETTEKLKKAVALGFFQENSFTSLMGDIRGLEQCREDILSFSEAHSKLAGVRAQVVERRLSVVESIRCQLVESVPEDHPCYERVASTLDSGDVHTANEYIQLIKDGRDLPEPEFIRDILSEFTHGLRAIEDYLEPVDPQDRPNWPAVVASLKKHAKHRSSLRFGPIDMEHVRGNQARSAATLLNSWFTLKQLRPSRKDFEKKLSLLNELMEALGFNDVVLAVEKKSPKIVEVNLSTRVLSDRETCPVSKFGSMARGNYRLVLVWNRPTEDELLNEIGETSGKAPVICLHFGRLTDKRRKDIAEICRRRRRTFVLLDDLLVLFLCGEKHSRLPAFFACSLPFTFIEPYTTTAGLVPSEIFFGRRRERDQIIEPFGSCFIFGGRQLGKTALLRNVERTFHEPEVERFAIYLDLKTKGIGLDHPLDDIWELLETEFKRLGVIAPSARTNANPLKIGREIKEWVDGDDNRCILLMLDEADRFLASDGERDCSEGGTGEGFVRTARLKGWMDDTQRRFKVVFAGLHNVQRTTRLSNHPLAQYGTPICIGPLFDNGEMREARLLVEYPLQKCGFVFESEDLSMRILAQTNYFPSLIQLYCSQLLRHLNESQSRAFEMPPHLIRADDVEAAYQSQDLRKAIRDRFMWTLQLDPRYEVIAYSIAYACLEDHEKGIAHGFPIEEIENHVLTWWPEGFKARHADIPLEGLLEEMVGLGILREVGQRAERPYYTLRSGNVLMLLGTEDEIYRQLDTPRELEPPYEPATFRSAYRGTDTRMDPGRRNPLTTEQERTLRKAANDISVIAGSELARRSDLPAFLKGSSPGFFVDLGDRCGNAEFQKALNELSKRESDGTTIVLVGPESPWSSKWVNDARERLKRLTSKTRFVHIVFCANSQKLWSEMDTGVTEGALRLGPWHDSMLRLWLDDCGFKVSPDERGEIGEATGNWPYFLMKLYEAARDNIHSWKECLDQVVMAQNKPAYAEALLAELAIPAEARPVLKMMTELGEEVQLELLVDLCSNIPKEIVKKTVRWSCNLSYVHRQSDGAYMIDSVLARLIAASAT